MKTSIIICCTLLFFFCLLVLRDFTAAVMACLTFIAGVNVGRKEAAVTAYVDGIAGSIKKQFK